MLKNIIDKLNHPLLLSKFGDDKGLESDRGTFREEEELQKVIEKLALDLKDFLKHKKINFNDIHLLKSICLKLFELGK